MIECPYCRRELPDASIAAGGSFCPGCGTKLERPNANFVGGHDDAAVGECKRCRAAFPASQLAPAPLVLRAVAFPLILALLLRRPLTLGGHATELADEYCPSCRKRQIFCYFVVGLWSSALVIGLIYEWVVKNR